MRIVRYDSQQRVDLPDITAMSYLVLGEFRRTLRGMMLGPGGFYGGSGEHDNFVLRGFAVTAQGTPDATVNITLDPGGSSPLGFAIGAENLGSRIDHGQLLGGDNSDASLEGNAVTVFDFTGQPNNTYLLQARFVYQDGVNDNRAFWNEASNTEFIAATDTRSLPVLEAGIAVAPTSLGDEWIPLATVVWGGSTVTSGNITDVRVGPFEGPKTVGGAFNGSVQNLTFGVGDFDRSTDRRNNGINEVYPALRALARQIQDLKGQNNLGVFDWYSRVYTPFDPGGLSLASEQTKSLVSIDTVTFTIGDGATTFGDFNGATGLELCLDHIDAQSDSNQPGKYRIVLKTYDNSSFTWTVTNKTYSFSSGSNRTEIEILAAGTDGTTTAGSGTPKQANIAWSLAASSASCLVSHAITMRDVKITLAGAGTNNSLLVANIVDLENCDVEGLTAAAHTGWTVNISHPWRSRISRCYVRGRVQLGAPGLGLSATTANSYRTVLEDSFFEEAEIHSGDSYISFEMRRCRVEGRDAAPYTASPAVMYLRAARDVVIEDCYFTYNVDQDCIRIIDDVSFNEALNITIDNCEFIDSPGTHSAGTGTNGGFGTGWCVYADPITRLNISECRFFLDQVRDAGAVRIDGTQCLIRDCVAQLVQVNLASSSATFIALTDGLGSTSPNRSVIRGNRLLGMTCPAGTPDLRGIRLVNVHGVHIEGNTLIGGADTTAATLDGAIHLDIATAVKIIGNHFDDWNDGVATSRTIKCTATDNCEYTIIKGNFFERCGGFCVQLDGDSAHSIISDNVVVSADANNEGFAIAPGSGTGSEHVVFSGNTFAFSGDATARDAILIDGAAAGNFMLSGNAGDGPTTIHNRSALATSGQGFNETPDFNNMGQAYSTAA